MPYHGSSGQEIEDPEWDAMQAEHAAREEHRHMTEQADQQQPTPLTLEEVTATLTTLGQALDALARRVDALESSSQTVDYWIERHGDQHDRQGARTSDDLARLRDQLRDREHETYRLETEVRQARDEARRQSGGYGYGSRY